MHQEVIDTTVVKQIVKVKIPFSQFSININETKKMTFKDNLFFYANVFLGVTITLFTFIWGIIS